MEGILAVLVTTFVLFILFSIALVYADIETIKQNWDTRRCDLPIMITGGLYKPNTYTKSSSEFASENFNYCGRKIANDVIRLGMSPFYSILGGQINAQQSMTGPINNMRGMLATTKNQFSQYLNLQYKKYETIILGITKLYIHMKFAMGRIQAILYSMVYLMISMVFTIMNTIKLTLFAVKVFLGILMALMILLFPVLSPFMIIITTVTAIISAFGLAAADAADDAMCIDPAALVYMADGSKKHLSEVKAGDLLKSLNLETINRVEGILVADGSKTTLYEIQGIRMSGSHSVQYNSNWILAKEHPEAIQVSDTLSQLICLNTTTHEVLLVGTHKTILVNDWEEVSSLQGQHAWIDYVNLVLNGGASNVLSYPTSIPLVSPENHVISELHGRVPIGSIQLGDRVLSKHGYTAVKAIYTGQLRVKVLPTTPEWISDGVWCFKYPPFWIASSSGVQSFQKGKYSLKGVFLITEDGTFILEHNKSMVLVRDFTEVGLDKIDQSYSMIQTFLNKK
jgi:hypothetical protein